MARDCDNCFLLTAREAEKQRRVINDDFPVTLCDLHAGRHNIVSWIERGSAGWFQCSCGEDFKTEGFDSERSMAEVFEEHLAAAPSGSNGENP